MSTAKSEGPKKNVKRQKPTVKVCFNCERESSKGNVCTVCGEELVAMSRSEFVKRMKGDA
jgi:hypothetical protein